jgi:hypothetical protein
MQVHSHGVAFPVYGVVLIDPSLIWEVLAHPSLGSLHLVTFGYVSGFDPYSIFKVHKRQRWKVLFIPSINNTEFFRKNGVFSGII